MRHCVTLAVDSRCQGFRGAKFETNTDGVLQDTDCVRWWMSLVLFTQVPVEQLVLLIIIIIVIVSVESSSSSESRAVREYRLI